VWIARSHERITKQLVGRREHVLLYQLFGDPLVRPCYPHEVNLASAPEATASERK